MVDESDSGRLDFYFMGVQMANVAKKQSIESLSLGFSLAVFDESSRFYCFPDVFDDDRERKSENRNPFCLLTARCFTVIGPNRKDRGEC